MRLLAVLPLIALSVASVALGRPAKGPSLDVVPAEVRRSFTEFLPDRDLSAFSQTGRAPRSESMDTFVVRRARHDYIQLFGTSTFTRKFARRQETPQETLAAINTDMRRVYEFGQRGPAAPSPASITLGSYDFRVNHLSRLHEIYANTVFDYDPDAGAHDFANAVLYYGMPGNLYAQQVIDALRLFHERRAASLSGFIPFNELCARLIDPLMLLEATGGPNQQVDTVEAVPLHIRAYMVSQYFAFWVLLLSDEQSRVHNLALISTARYIIGGADMAAFRQAFLDAAGTEHIEILQSYTAEGRELLQHNQVAASIPEPVMRMINEFFAVL